ncbi:hypothetical protein SAMN05443662_1057 [Sulfurivirga caldicuralii]|uniref:Esterase n=1 Tax=Sulfurivirga caldicuralii TaxID=364032 RepID=A0A1N6FFD8_9GAMM|nr:YqiA/YcfP family alpha/beta fold hydrolase [Sulfurivirga caldicuralii]SIN93967.1 hypothetical protein SAMN05443662_1057 [Sulfurivirga caldicuralii]
MANTQARPLLVYVHGFMSSGSTLKGQALRRHFGDRFEPCTPTYPQTSPSASIEALEKEISAAGAQKGVIVGSSLGGFYGQYLAARHGWPLVMINPALDMACVPSSLTGTHVNPYTGEKVVVDETWLAQLAPLHTEPVSPSQLIVCADDTTVLPRCALERYDSIAEVVFQPQGGHACWPLTPVLPQLDAFMRCQFGI